MSKLKKGQITANKKKEELRRIENRKKRTKYTYNTRKLEV